MPLSSPRFPPRKAPTLASAPLVAFVATTDAERAIAFYRDALQLELVADEPYAVVFSAHGTMLRVSKVAQFTPQPYTVLGWSVPDLRALIPELSARGVRFEIFEGMGQDELGVCTFPSGAQVVWFQDPDGNVLSLTQFPPAH